MTSHDPHASPTVSDRLRGAGVDAATLARVQAVPAVGGAFEADAPAHSRYWAGLDDLQRRLGGAAGRSAADAAAVLALREHAAATRAAFLDRHAGEVYRRLTGDRRRHLRIERLVADAAALVPGLVPSTADLDAERGLALGDKPGLELYQGIFLGKIAALPDAGHHLCHAMLLPRAESAEALAAFQRDGRLDLGRARVERRGPAAVVTLDQPERLNCEDDGTLAPFETCVDVALLDPDARIGVLRGAAVPHPHYAGRNIFGSGINLTALYRGEVSYVFYLTRDLGLVNKLFRGVARPESDPSEVAGGTTEKLWIAALEGFAIGGACQLLLVVDHVIAERDAYMTLPARKEGIIPGMANLRLPRFVGERIARQAILDNRRIDCDSPEGRMICDEIVVPGAVDAALDAAIERLTGAGVVSAAGNRRAFRVGIETLDLFRQYVAAYAREQAFCHLSPALVANLEAHWRAHERTVA